MRVFKKKTFLVAASSILLLSASCSMEEDKDDDDDSSSSTVNSTSGFASSLENGSSLSSLNLSGALNIDVPSSLSAATGSSAALNLAAAKKSHEACEVGHTVSEGIRSIKSVANMFCHIEVESDNIKYGVKYKINIGDGDNSESLGIWVDDSDAANGNLKVNFCQGSNLTEIINVTGVGTDSSKGSVLRHGTWEGNTYAESVKFDNGFTTAGETFISVNSKFSAGTGSEEFKRQLVMKVIEGGTDTIMVSNAGTWGGSTFAHAGGARLNDSYGQVVYKSQGSHNGSDFQFTHRAYFDSNGLVAAAGATADFSTDGALYVPDAEVPAFLPSDFAVAAFGADAWDCTTEEEFDIDMTSGDKAAAHDACEGDMDNDEMVDCWGAEYEQSSEDHTIDETEQKDYDQLDDKEEI